MAHKALEGVPSRGVKRQKLRSHSNEAKNESVNNCQYKKPQNLTRNAA
jgi:hypothetical protein